MRLRDRFRLAVQVLRGSVPGPGDDFWYANAPTFGGLAGVRSTPENAMRLSAVQACVFLIAGTIAGLPLWIYRRLGDGGKTPEPRHPLFDLLNYMPNSWQSSFEWREQMTAHLMLKGNGYSQIIPGPRGFADTLIPWMPDSVRPELLDPQTLIYHVRGRDGITRVFPADEVFHLRDLTLDGVCGLSRIEQAGLSVGMTLSAQVHASAVMGQGGKPSVQIVTAPTTTLNDDQKRAAIKLWKETYGGPANAGGVVIFDKGAKAEALTVSNEQMQLLELLNYGVEDIARLYGVPPHLIGLSDKQTSWGTGVEQMTIGFVNFYGMRWANLWEAAILRDLVLAPQTYFAEHKFDGLLRGDYKTRTEGIKAAIESGQLSPNEGRKLDNQPPREDGQGDRYWMPANFRYADEPFNPAQAARPAASVPSNGGGKVITETEATS